MSLQFVQLSAMWSGYLRVCWSVQHFRNVHCPIKQTCWKFGKQDLASKTTSHSVHSSEQSEIRARKHVVTPFKGTVCVCAIQAVFWRIHTRQFCQQLLFPTQPLINFGPWLCLMCTVGDTATSRSGTGSRPTCQMCFQSSLIDYIQGQPRWHARMRQLIALRCTSGCLFTYWLISKVSTVQAVEAHWLYQTWVWGCVHW